MCVYMWGYGDIRGFSVVLGQDERSKGMKVERYEVRGVVEGDFG